MKYATHIAALIIGALFGALGTFCVTSSDVSFGDSEAECVLLHAADAKSAKAAEAADWACQSYWSNKSDDDKASMLEGSLDL